MSGAIDFRIARLPERDAIAAIWSRAQEARRRSAPSQVRPFEAALALVESRMQDESSWFLIGAVQGRDIALAHGVLARDLDGDGDPIPGLMHLSMIAVEPDVWGRGYGRGIVVRSLALAEERGYGRVQLWTQPTNARARRPYESVGFMLTGREKLGDAGEPILHYVLDPLRALASG